MATHSSILAWKTPWTEEPGRLQSMGFQRVRHNQVTKQQQHTWSAGLYQVPSDLACTKAFLGFPGGSDGKASACNARHSGSIPGSGRSPGEGNGNPLQYSCLENSMDGGAWWATAHGVTKSHTWLSDFTHSLTQGILSNMKPKESSDQTLIKWSLERWSELTKVSTKLLEGLEVHLRHILPCSPVPSRNPNPKGGFWGKLQISLHNLHFIEHLFAHFEEI